MNSYTMHYCKTTNYHYLEMHRIMSMTYSNIGSIFCKVRVDIKRSFCMRENNMFGGGFTTKWIPHSIVVSIVTLLYPCAFCRLSSKWFLPNLDIVYWKHVPFYKLCCIPEQFKYAFDLHKTRIRLKTKLCNKYALRIYELVNVLNSAISIKILNVLFVQGKWEKHEARINIIWIISVIWSRCWCTL